MFWSLADATLFLAYITCSVLMNAFIRKATDVEVKIEKEPRTERNNDA